MNSTSQTVLKAVPVAKFRNAYDHLFRMINADYHACVTIGELENWKVRAAVVLAELEGLCCSRASSYDQEQRLSAIGGARAAMVSVEVRITALHDKNAAKSPAGQPAPFRLYLIQGGLKN